MTILRSGLIAAIAVAAATLACPAAGAASPARPAGGRVLVAAGTLTNLVDAPRYFDVVRITLAPRAIGHVAVGDGIVYQLSGAASVSVDGATTALEPGDGRFIAAGHAATITANGDVGAVILDFLVSRGSDLERDAVLPAAVAKRSYRTDAPIPGLEAGAYDINLARITFPGHSPVNPSHHRTGAALYYVLAGSGANVIDGKTLTRSPGTFVYEPSTLVHQWGNPGDEAFTFLIFNINRTGVPAVVRAEPAAAK